MTAAAYLLLQDDGEQWGQPPRHRALSSHLIVHDIDRRAHEVRFDREYIANGGPLPRTIKSEEREPESWPLP